MDTEAVESELRVACHCSVDVVVGGNQACFRAEDILADACDVVGDGDCRWFKGMEDSHVLEVCWWKGVILGNLRLDERGEGGGEYGLGSDKGELDAVRGVGGVLGLGDKRLLGSHVECGDDTRRYNRGIFRMMCFETRRCGKVWGRA